MVKYLLFIAVFFCFMACHKDDLPEDTPSCIQAKIQDFSKEPDSKTVKRTSIEGEFHYWFNDDASQRDGGESILNENCEIVCGFCGECLNEVCDSIYAGVRWETIWCK